MTEGHVAIVTGANHGIGAATARAFARAGASVFLQFLREPGPSTPSGTGPASAGGAPPGDALYRALKSRDAGGHHLRTVLQRARAKFEDRKGSDVRLIIDVDPAGLM